MPIELLPLGPPTTMQPNVIYALPAVKCTLFTDGSPVPTLQVSNTSVFTNNQALTLVAGVVTVAGGGFIRSTASPALVTLKRD
jgi:hypothetical protein